jgi:hypothetical protein
MIDDLLITLRILLFSGSGAERDLLRSGAVTAFVPVELVEAEGSAAARAKIADYAIDIVFADVSIPAAERAAFIVRRDRWSRSRLCSWWRRPWRRRAFLPTKAPTASS